MTIATEIIRAHQAHPALHAKDIAALVGCSYSYVRATKQMCALAIPRKSHGRPPSSASGKVFTAAFWFSLSREVLDALKAEAVRQNVSISALIRTYCERGLAQDVEERT